MGRRVLVAAVAVVTLPWGARGDVLAQDAPEAPRVRVEVPPGDVVQELQLEDGSRLFGRVETADEEQVVFRTVSGARLELARDEIKELRRVRGRIEEGDFVRHDPNRTRLFFGPTARSLPKGRGYLGVYELVMPFVQVGLTDRITIGGGTPLVFGSGMDNHPFWFTPKIQLFRGESVQLAAGVMQFVFTGDEEPVGIGYGVVTAGSRDASVTVGAGYGYGDTDDGVFVAMLGGDVRVARGVKLLAEGYVVSEGVGIVMGGLRFFGSRLSADLGVVTAVDSDDAFVFPVVNVVWTF